MSSHSTSSTSSSSSEYHHRPSSAFYWAYCGSFFVWALGQSWDWALACLEMSWNILTATHLDTPTLYRISNSLLACHYLSILLVGGDGLIPVYDADATWWLWALPLVTGSVALVVVIPLLFLLVPVQSLHQGAIVTALVSLFLLEALVPVILLVCTSLCLLQKLSWATGCFVLGVVWMGVALAVHWIQCLVYQNLGHG